MKFRSCATAWLSVIALSCTATWGATPKGAQTQVQPASKPASGAKSDVAGKLVDINSASAKELETLPGIGDAEAAKIIAGRPYGSKSWLATHRILDESIYDGIRHLIVARQPYKDGARNAALYAHPKP
jgi:competence protein ComEA